jgi:ABC-2 type transport system permease protein
LFLLPAGLAVFVRATAPDAPPVAVEFVFAFMFIPQGLLPLVGLLYASGMIQDEQEEQTLTYLLMRPIPRWALYGTKWLATVTTTVCLTALFTGLTYAAIYAGGGGVAVSSGRWTPPPDVPLRCLKAMGIHSLAVMAYCSLFGVISLFTRRTLIVGIVYAALVEGLLANFPLSLRLVTVIYYARVIAYRTMGFVVATPMGKEDVAGRAWQLDVINDPTLSEHPTLRGCVNVLVGASLACTVLAAVLCARREFHVKTPEKG